MAGLPEIRVIVDWDNNRFFQQAMAATDPLNLIATPLTLVDINLFKHTTNSSYTHEAEITDYGINKQRVITSTDTTGGLDYGYNGTTVSTIPISASTTYTVTMWVKGITNFSGIGMTAEAFDQAGNSAGSITFTLTGSWQKVNFTATFGVGDTATRIVIRKTNSAVNVTFDVAGVMITLGTTVPTVYNTGQAINRYEDISEDVISANWDSQIERRTFTPNEGVLNLELDNSARKYSPRYTGSVLYGYMVHGLRVKIEIKRASNSTWVPMWYGWITGYDVHPGGRRGDLKTSVQASQGLFNLDSSPVSSVVQENITLDTVFRDVLGSHWYPASTPYVFVLDKTTLDENRLNDPVDLIANAGVGVTTFPLVGADWTDKETPGSKILKDLNEVERGWIYLDRLGRFNFANREHYNKDTAVSSTISLDTQSNRASYVFAPVEINSVNLTYYPDGTQENQIVWQSKGRGTLVNRRRTRTIHAKLEYEEGSKITVKSLNPFGTGGTDSTFSATSSDGAPISAKRYFLTAELKNGEAIITIYSTTFRASYVLITLRGTIETKADNEQIQIATEDTAQDLREININNRLIKDPDDGTDLANHLITLYGDDHDEFSEIEIQARDNTWLDRALDLVPGMLIALSEYQTGVTSKKHLVIGESHVWTPGHLISRFQTSRIDERVYWILGTSALNTDTVLSY